MHGSNWVMHADCGDCYGMHAWWPVITDLDDIYFRFYVSRSHTTPSYTCPIFQANNTDII